MPVPRAFARVLFSMTGDNRFLRIENFHSIFHNPVGWNMMPMGFGMPSQPHSLRLSAN
jgi:hypothetical protein